MCEIDIRFRYLTIETLILSFKGYISTREFFIIQVLPQQPMPVFIILPFVSVPIYRWDTAYYPFTLWLYNYTISILCLSGWQISGDGRRVGGSRSDKHRFLITYDSNKKLYLVRLFDIVVGERPSCSCSVGRHSYPLGRCPCWSRPLLCCSVVQLGG